MTDDSWILHRIWQSRDSIRANLVRAERQIDDYCRLQADLRSQDVRTDPDYRRRFVQLYRMFRQPKEWLDSFFALLEDEKDNPTIAFASVLAALSHSRVEASFSSKLVATIRPKMPVLDQYVLANLGLRSPSSRGAMTLRLRLWSGLYDDTCTLYRDLLTQRLYQDVAEYFDGSLASFPGLTEVKKLDLLLWQLR